MGFATVLRRSLAPLLLIPLIPFGHGGTAAADGVGGARPAALTATVSAGLQMPLPVLGAAAWFLNAPAPPDERSDRRSVEAGHESITSRAARSRAWHCQIRCLHHARTLLRARTSLPATYGNPPPVSLS